MSKFFGVVLAICVCLSATVVRAAGPLADDPANKKWDLDGNVLTYTEGGAPATISVVLNKAAISGQKMSIHTDGSYVTVSAASVDGIHVILELKAGGPVGKTQPTEGAVNELKLVCGDSPALTLNGDEPVRETGHWKRVAKSTDAAITLELNKATFAKITIEKPADTKAPPPPPQVKAAPSAPAAPIGTGTVTSNKLNAGLRIFSETVCKKCVKCGGTGKVKINVQTGTRHTGASLVPVTEDREVDCPTCKGKGEIRGSDEQVRRDGGAVISSLINFNLQDPKAQDSLKTAYTTLTNTIIGDKPCWDNFTKDARSTLALAHPKVGTPVVAEVKIHSVETDAAGHRTFKAHLPGSTNTFLILNPPTADNVASGYCLMGGLIDSTVDNGNGKTPMVVVRGGFLISPDIDRRWSWWDTH